MSKNKYYGLCVVSIFYSLNAYSATQPKFSIVPATPNGNVVNISNNSSRIVSYVVTNNTGITRTLTMKPIRGVSIDTSGVGACTTPFTLAANGGSCTLYLNVKGALISRKGIKEGPVICKTMGPNSNTPDPFLCSEPSAAGSLTIYKEFRFAYVGNQSNNGTTTFGVTKCSVDRVSGNLSNCSNSGATAAGGAPLGDVEGITLNEYGTAVYIADNTTRKIYKCNLDISTGNLSACVDSNATGLGTPGSVNEELREIVFNPTYTGLYITVPGLNGNTSYTQLCYLDSSTGLFSSCTTAATFTNEDDVRGIAINKAGTLAYFVYSQQNKYYLCNITASTGLLTNCTSISYTGNPSDQLGRDIVINSQNTFGYMTLNNGYLQSCSIASNTGYLENCSYVLANSGGSLAGIKLNADETSGYIADVNADTVLQCSITETNGSMGNCTTTSTSGMNAPDSIALR